MPDHLKRRPTVGERAAALASLLALAAAVVLLLIGVVLHLTAVLLTIVGAGVFVTAGWYAVSRRGTVRAAGPRAPGPAAPPCGETLPGGEDRAPAIGLDDHGAGPGASRTLTAPVVS